MYWIHLRVCNSLLEHITCLHPTFNNLPKIYAAVGVYFSWKEDTTSTLSRIPLQIHFVPFLESQVCRRHLTIRPCCMKSHRPRLSKHFRELNIYIHCEYHIFSPYFFCKHINRCIYVLGTNVVND